MSEAVESLVDLEIQDQSESKESSSTLEDISKPQDGSCANNHHGFCTICLSKIKLQETALVKGCEHAYCVTCILRWASYKEKATCPQCKHPFEFLIIHRALDGRIHDYMFEESVCLLLRASWFKPLVVVEKEEGVYDEMQDYFHDEDLEEVYLGNSLSRLRIGNQKWGDSRFSRGGRQEARPAHRPSVQKPVVGPSPPLKKKEGAAAKATDTDTDTDTDKELVGRRAKRALKREAADKAAAAKHQQHLARFGRK